MNEDESREVQSELTAKLRVRASGHSGSMRERCKAKPRLHIKNLGVGRDEG